MDFDHVEKLFIKYRGTENRLEAMCFLEKILDLFPDKPIFWALYGNDLSTLEKWDESEEAYKIAVKLDPDSAIVLLGMGQMYLDRYLLDKAESCIYQALAIQDDLPEAYLILGAIGRERAQYKKSEEFLRYALKLQPKFDEAHLFLGLVLMDQKLYSEAEIQINKAIELDPDYGEAHNSLKTLATLKKQKTTP